ncbi:MAG: hypothetical protein EDX89_08415 [Acidobacteria bacterium]|nr:MAG: hypothetical protein EDX89_08415 [Acidobacteriota bacterium]
MFDEALGVALKKLILGVAGGDGSRAVAYGLAPAVVMTIGFLIIGRAQLIAQPEEAVALLELQSALGSNGSAMEHPGVLLLLEGTFEPFAVPLTGPHSEMVTTLDRQTLEANQDRLRFSPALVRVNPPILGTEALGILLPQARVNGLVSFPGRQVDPKDLELPSRRSEALAAWGLIAALAISLSVLLDQPASLSADA